MRILITGAGGLVGRTLTSHYRIRDEVFPLGHGELDITSGSDIENAVQKIRPDLVINCAVIGVDDCEKDPALSYRINVEGPSLLASAAEKSGARMLHFSTNYVFSGDRSDGQFYDVDDSADPINTYGRHKLEGERRVIEECSSAWIIRTSWVFGAGKDSFLATAPSNLRNGTRVSAIEDVYASNTWVSDLVERAAAILDRGEAGTYHVNNSGVCSHADFADAAGTILGLSSEERTALIVRKTEAEVSRLAARPRWTPMRCSRSERLGLSPLRPWQEALRAYIETMPLGG